MPRRKNVDPPTRWYCHIPESLSEAVDATLRTDPLRLTPAYGERTKLVTALLREWLERHKPAHPQPPPPVKDPTP